MKKRVGQVLEDFLCQYIYPKGIYCIICGAITDSSRNYSLCDSCMNSITWLKGENKNLVASDWKNLRELYEDAFSCMVYGKQTRIPILAFKHGEATYLARELGEMLSDRILLEIARREGEIFFDCIIPIPLHPKRLKERGYNQAELLAAEVSDKTGVSVICDALIRVKYSEMSQKLSAEERMSNLKDAFYVEKDSQIKDRSILVIDDVCTTGATAVMAAKALKQAGARKLYLLTIASGPLKILTAEKVAQ